RWRPDTDELEALNGVSQQGRVRDDFGSWFGNDNSTLLWHFPLPVSARWRNPHQPPPDPRVFVQADPPRVYPVSPTLLRFNDPQTANQLTSACAPEIYRDDWLGTGLSGNALVCEPVHNLVRRAVLEREGASFRARRAAGEETREFLASTDSWFRPVEVRTGPDGALWVVDFCRYVIEHPRWIPPDRRRDLVIRAGADHGRIWRVRSAGRPARPVVDGTRLGPRRLVEVLDSPNGVVRDLADRELRQRLGGRRDARVMPRLLSLAGSSPRPGVRAQALSLVVALGDATEQERALQVGLRDADPAVRRLSLELMPGAAAQDPLAGAVLEALADPDAGVRFEALLAAGRISPASRVVARLGEQWEGRMKDDGWRVALTGVLPGLLPDLVEWLAAEPGRWAASEPMWGPLMVTAVQGGDVRSREGLARLLARPDVSARAGLLFLAAWERRPAGTTAAATAAGSASLADLLAALEQRVAPEALRLLADGQAPVEERLAAVDWLGETARRQPARRRRLVGLLDALPEGRLRQAAWGAVRRQTDPALAAELLGDWPRFSLARRRETLEALLARPEWTVEVLQAGIEGRLAAGDFPLEPRERLRNHAEGAIRERAVRLFPGDRAERAAVVRRHAAAAGLAGRPERGAEHFDRRCASCHAVRGRGHAVGPDLTYFRAKPAGDFLAAILDPSAAIEPRYVGYQVRRRDGRELTGVIRSETAEGFQMVQPGGVVEMLRRDEVETLQAGERSLMPEGLEEGLGDQDLADLIAWLRQVPAPFGQAAEGQVRDARRAFRSDQPTPLLRLECTGEVLEYPGWLGRLPLHACRQTDGASRVTWQARVPPAGPAGHHRFRFAAAMGYLSQPAGRFTLHVHGRASVDFDVALEDREWVGPDGKLRLRYTVQERNGEDGCGLLEIEAAPGWLAEGETIWLEVVGTASQSQRWFGLYQVSAAD
ncbi:MAG: c-type cytochrome, partial [Verrucomicrobiota bacterium]